MRYRLVIFDCDGTLADTLPLARRLFNQLAREQGFRPLAPEDHDRLRDCSEKELLQELQLPLWKLPRLVIGMRQLMSAHLHECGLFPGVPGMLESLDAAGVALGVVSTNSEENVRTVLGPELAGRIRHFACGASLFGKARNLRAALRTAGMEAGQTLYLGDELRDGEAAHAAGMAFGAVLWGQHSENRLRGVGPEEVFHAVSEIAPRVLGESSPPQSHPPGEFTGPAAKPVCSGPRRPG